MTTSTTVRLRTYAKLNLFLRVLGRRPDGFHEVETILHGIGLHDELSLASGSSGVRVKMRMGAGIPGVMPQERDNIVTRAVEYLRRVWGEASGMEVIIDKATPIGAGLGGGSANAAGALIAAADVWGMEDDRDTVMEIARELGSDVPYCIEGGTALATGRGEQLTHLSLGAPMWFVLAGPGFSLSTKEVYATWDELDVGTGPSNVAMTLALGAGDAAEVAALLHNDLEPAAIALDPRLTGCKEAITTAGALGAGMTGSGPVMFGIAHDEDHARQIAEAIERDFPWVRVVPSQATGIERLD